MTRLVKVRRLTAADVPALQELLEAAPGYHSACQGTPAQGQRRVRDSDRPAPGLAPGAKHVLGLWGRGCLLAVADLLRGWPRPRTAYVGLLLVREDHACQGVGEVAA